MQKKIVPPRDRGRYTNPYAKDCRRSLIDILAWKLGFYDDKRGWQKPSSSFSYPLPLSSLVAAKPYALWVGHSTVYLKALGAAFITDPIFSDRCSPFSFLGPRRLIPPAIQLDEIEDLHFALISHDHYDHLDKKSVLALSKKFPNLCWIVSYGLKDWFSSLGIHNTVELSWWEAADLDLCSGVKVHITAVPAQHFSGRGLTDQNKTLWCGFVVEIIKGDIKKQCYFAGDTGYNPFDFKEIGRVFGSMDLSLIPIGSYRPKVFMAPVHIDPLEAFWIHRDVHSRLSFGIHWNTFALSDEGQLQPPFDLYKALDGKEDHKRFLAARQGYAFNW